MSDKLKPCPFCGGDAMLIGRPLHFNHMFDDGERAYHIECSLCWVRTPEVTDEESAVNSWNRRDEK